MRFTARLLSDEGEATDPVCRLLHVVELDLDEPPQLIQWGARMFLCDGMRLGGVQYSELVKVHRLPVSASNPPSMAMERGR
jgi:hypothetical protein